MAHPLTAAGALLAAAWVLPAAAQGQPDPTRPPSMVLSPAATSSAEEGGGLELQSVLIAPDRRAAVIGGHTVPLGGRVGGYTLTAVRDSEVSLSGPEGVRVLRLYPGVEKRPVAAERKPAGPKKASARKTKR